MRSLFSKPWVFLFIVLIIGASTSVSAQTNSWSQKKTPNDENVDSLAFDPVKNNLFAVTHSGIYKSANGNSWSLLAASKGNHFGSGLALDSINRVIYSGTNVGVFKTGGGPWSVVANNAGLTRTYVISLTFDSNTETVYAGVISTEPYGGGIFKSTKGEPWSLVDKDKNAAINHTNINALAYDSKSRTLYVGTDRGVFQSINGKSWVLIGKNTNLSDMKTMALALDPSSQVLYAGTDQGLYQSKNGGPWSFMTHLNRLSINALAFDPSTRVHYAATSLREFFSIQLL